MVRVSCAAGSQGSIETVVEPHPEQPETMVQLLLDNGDTVWDGQTKISKDLDPEEQQFQGAYIQLGVAQPDNTAPALVRLTPENGLVGVNTDTRIELTFDEGITLSDEGAMILYRDGYPVQTYFKYSNEVSVRFNTLVIRPSTPLDYESDYSIRLQGDFVL
ncbi:Ig-like domain-containing protein, partial [Marinobacter sp.]|uniref:Ig-like domain-containing protein n=1 Tax=Marinobacter sp. TaxID=50741 RepID=UPI0035664ACC